MGSTIISSPRNKCRRPLTAASSLSTPCSRATCTAPGTIPYVSVCACVSIAFSCLIECPSRNRHCSLEAVRLIQETGKVCVLDIDMQGVMQIRKVPSVKPVGVFIKPPSISELEKRLRRRASESEDSLQARLNAAQQEINYGQSNELLLT